MLAAFYGSRLLGNAGLGLFMSALFLLAGQSVGVALGLSTVWIAMTVAAVVLGFPGGAMVDRIGYGPSFAIGGGLRLLAATSALLLVGQPQFIWLVAFAYSAASQLFSPAELASVSLLRAERTSVGHALLVALQYGGYAIGLMLLAPALYFLGGAAAMVVGAIVLYGVVAALALWFALRVGSQPQARVLGRRSFAPRQTFSFFAAQPQALFAAGLLTFADISIKCLVIALPLYVYGELGFQQLELMVLAVPLGVGVVGGLIWSRRLSTTDIATRVIRGSLVGLIAGLVLLLTLGDGVSTLGQLPELSALSVLRSPVYVSLALALPCALLLGLWITLAPVGARAVLSESAKGGEHGRVFATQTVASNVLIIGPLLFTGILTELFGARPTLLFVGVAGLALLLTLGRTHEQRLTMGVSQRR